MKPNVEGKPDTTGSRTRKPSNQNTHTHKRNCFYHTVNPQGSFLNNLNWEIPAPKSLQSNMQQWERQARLIRADQSKGPSSPESLHPQLSKGCSPESPKHMLSFYSGWRAWHWIQSLYRKDEFCEGFEWGGGSSSTMLERQYMAIRIIHPVYRSRRRSAASEQSTCSECRRAQYLPVWLEKPWGKQLPARADNAELSRPMAWLKRRQLPMTTVKPRQLWVTPTAIISKACYMEGALLCQLWFLYMLQW